MKYIVTYIGVLLIVLFAASVTSAAIPEARCGIKQAPKVELACGIRGFHHDRGAANWIKNHTGKTLLASFSNSSLHSTKFYDWRMRVDKRWIRQARYRLRPHPIYVSGFPPHHALWLCLHSVEASSWFSIGPGHYGGLQMAYDWGYGIRGYASNYSQAEQEWAAERGYAAHHYSPSFIYDQWLEWENGAGDKCIPLE